MIVPKSSSRVRKLWTGQPAACSFGAGLLLGGDGDLCRGDDGGTRGLGGGGIVVVEEQGFEPLAHVPFDVVGEHAQEDMSADAVGGIVVDGPDLEVDGLQAAEGALDRAQALVGADGFRGVERTGGQAGADDVQAVQGRFGRRMESGLRR